MTLREDALYASYRRLEKPLYNVLFRQLWQAEDCQDLIHDAYMRVWERRARVDEATLDSLVWVTAMNLARNRLRWRRLWRHEPLADTEPETSASAAPTDFLAQRQVHAALRRLPSIWREVLLLSQFSGLRDTEIAAVLGIATGTVASRKHHALRRLRDLLGAIDHA